MRQLLMSPGVSESFGPNPAPAASRRQDRQTSCSFVSDSAFIRLWNPHPSGSSAILLAYRAGAAKLTNADHSSQCIPRTRSFG